MSPHGYAPFLEFYGANAISPVHQDVSDMARHIGRRDHLYRALGLPPFSVTGKKVLEFGPGSGHNALYTTSLRPARYVLVDGNYLGLTEAQALLLARYPEGCHEFVLSRLEAFDTEERFDIVLCEGVIPHQAEPAAMAREVARFVKPGGVLVLTCADYVSVLSEVMRRLIRDTLIDSDAPLSEQLAILRSVFASHFASLPAASRPLDDWIADTIVMPWRHKLFSISGAIRSVGEHFDVYGSSPRFLTDWRWYKEVYGSEADVNGRAVAQYLDSQLAFLDQRVSGRHPYGSIASYVVTIAQRLFELMLDIEATKKDRFGEVAELCDEMVFALVQVNDDVAQAMREAAEYFRRRRNPVEHFKAFVPWFGRAQQYLSFIRRLV